MKLILINLISLSIISCSKSSTEKYNELKSTKTLELGNGMIWNIIIDEATSVNFVIPSIGCESCNGKVISFSEEVLSPMIGFTITNINSYRDLEIRFKSSFLQKATIDSANSYLDVMKDYPFNPWLVIETNEKELINYPIHSSNIDSLLEAVKAMDHKIAHRVKIETIPPFR